MHLPAARTFGYFSGSKARESSLVETEVWHLSQRVPRTP
ncbi:MAG: hypothetical protein PWQ39_1688 [Thermacetogenium sp.]|nr:hypothetical protein [Thermacetogenium sp.]